jgi:hypothetical protein
MDRNNDGVITRAEWRGNARSFDRHDINDDGVLSGNEIWVGDADPVAGGGPLEQVFQSSDTDNDGRLSRREWASGALTFRRVDVNGDGEVSLSEFLGEGWSDEDWNERGNEAVGTSGIADDISRAQERAQEDEGRVQRNTRAYQSGYDRGLEDGRQAGREDKQYRNQWDLQGQQELEQADAGYHTSLGPREEYQAGYRRGFRAGYRQGFGDREPRE